MKNMLHLIQPDGCSPGNPHELGIQEILLGQGALSELPSLLDRLAAAGSWKPGTIAVLCDANTRSAAGSAVAASLDNTSSPYLFCELKPEHDEDVMPDERTIGSALVAIPEDAALLIAVGSGTITDVTRYLAFRLHLPFVAIPTAPSVDGFTSSVAPLILGGLKTTLQTAAPAAVLADSAILAAAPRRLLSAGIGDLAGKLTARSDWFLAQTIEDEPMCTYIIEMVAGYIGEILKLDETRIASIEGAETLFEGLVVSGLGITLVGNSRPASGAEHHISHFLEMQHERGNAPRLYHGESVAVGTYLVSMLYHRLIGRQFAEIREAAERAIGRTKEQDASAVQSRVALFDRLFGEIGAPLVERLRSTRPDHERRRLVLSKLEANWDGVVRVVRSYLPTAESVASAFHKTGVPYDPVKIGISEEILHAALLCAKEVRPRYSVLTLLDELGMLEAEAAAVVEAMGYR